MALTTWGQVKVFGNLNVTTGTSDRIKYPSGAWVGQINRNAFSNSNTVEYFLGKNTFITLKLVDLYGREVVTLAERNITPGQHLAVFNTGGLAEGIYIWVLQADNFVRTREIILIK
jgi:hypothetical protein